MEKSVYKNTDSKYEKINFDEYFFPISTLDNEFSTVSKNSMLINSKLKNKIIRFKKKYKRREKPNKKNQYFKDLIRLSLSFFQIQWTYSNCSFYASGFLCWTT